MGAFAGCGVVNVAGFLVRCVAAGLVCSAVSASSDSEVTSTLRCVCCFAAALWARSRGVTSLSLKSDG